MPRPKKLSLITGRTRWIETYGDVSVRVLKRSDGRFKISWRESGKGRSTTAMRESDAAEIAKARAKALDQRMGGRVVTVGDAEMVARLRELAGERSAFLLLEEMDAAVRVLQGRATLLQAVRHYEQAGMLNVQRMGFVEARRRFLDGHGAKGIDSISSMRKALAGFELARPGVSVQEITAEDLREWLGRAVAPKTFNNRLGIWRTFLNRCRDWKALPVGEKHAAELIARRKEPDRVPPIFTPQVAAAALAALPDLYKPTFIVGCWMGPRPMSELRIIEWSDFDWERGYLHIRPEVARKTMRERFVPIPENVRVLLKPFTRQAGKVSGRMHVEEISKCLRAAGVIEAWPPDVMRHSYISYMIALGHGIGQVAEWAGNSERKIRTNYRRPLRKVDGEAWFTVGLTG
jgi:integrase